MALIKPLPVIETKTRKLPANGPNPSYYKIAKIQVKPTVDGGENATFQGSVFPQSDIAYTGSVQPLFTFSFGVRTSGAPNQLLIKPSLLKVGDSRENSFRFEIYRDAEKNHYLYVVQSPYSLQTVFTYTQVGCTEYWEYDNHFSERGYDLVWSSVNGDTQGIYEGGRRLLTETKANDTYMKKAVTNRINVDLREGWFHAENPLSITKRADIVTISGAVYHGKDGPYQIIGKVPTGYEPSDESLLSACYLKDDGSFANIPVVISIYGEIIQLGFRINNNKDRTKTIISGTYQTIGGM